MSPPNTGGGGLGPSTARVVPVTSFSEYETTPEGRKAPVWFAHDESPAALRIRRALGELELRSEEVGGGDLRRLWLPHDGAERRGRPDSPEGHAGDPHDARGPLANDEPLKL